MKLPSITFYLPNKKPNKHGQLPVMMQFIFQRKKHRKSTGINVDPSKFCSDTLIDSSVENSIYKNRLLKKIAADYELIFIKLQESKTLNTASIESALMTQSNSLKFERLMEIVLAKFAGTVTAGTLKQIEYEGEKLKNYRSGLMVHEMNNSFFLDYERYMRQELGNVQNTVRKTMVKLKSIFNKGVSLGIMEKNPMIGYKMPSYNQPEREVILKKNQIKIEKYARTGSNGYLKTVAAWFVLQCYSGLRYEDIRQWGILAKVVGNKLMIIDNKTKTPHHVPIYPGLAKAIKGIEGLGVIPTLQAYNRGLKELAGLLDIPNDLSSHKARHTFAVNFLNAGGSMLVLSKLLGHKDLKTTSIYGQITDERINSELKFLR